MIRQATSADIPAIHRLLEQVLAIHANGRPDIFQAGKAKYTNAELENLLNDENSPIFVTVNEEERVLGYVFCQYHTIVGDNILQNTKYLYIDDLCVDENYRGRHIGKKLYDYVVEKAKEQGCHSIRLNVWTLNKSATRFYEKLGFSPLKTIMENKL